MTEDTILFDDLLAQMPVATAAACMGFPVRELDVVALDAQYARMSDVPDDLRDPLLDSQNVKRLVRDAACWHATCGTCRTWQVW